MPTTQPVLSIHALKKNYGDVEVLHDISLSINKGEFLVLLGASGCGKSTLLNCIAGLEEVTEGKILINGRDMTNEPPKDRNISMVFQSYALYPNMTVAENITFGLKVRGLDSAEQQSALSRVSKILQIEQLLDRKPARLSGGQRQRVAMGRALVRDPALFLFDEPLSNLDAKLRVDMRAEIKRLHETVEASMVYVTHDQVEAMTLASKICVLQNGFIQQVGTPEDVYFRPANTFVAGFMGSPGMNLISASARAHDQETVIVFDDNQLTIPQQAGLHGRSIILGFRPEDAQTNGQIQFDQSLAVLNVEHTGGDSFVESAIAGQRLRLRLPARSATRRGDSLTVGLSIDCLHFFDANTGKRLPEVDAAL